MIRLVLLLTTLALLLTRCDLTDTPDATAPLNPLRETGDTVDVDTGYPDIRPGSP